MSELLLYPWQSPLQHWWQQVQAQQSLPHALLLSGPRGAGKRHLAQQITLALFSDDKAQQLYKAGTHPDFFSVTLQEKRKEISIEQIRDLAARVILTPQLGGWRVVSIDPADKLSRGSANALLKILEEPPQNVLFLLIADELDKLLPTIRSRCQHLKLGMPGRETALAWLAEQPECAALQVEDVKQWLALCKGSPLRVLECLSQGDEQSGALLLAGQQQEILQKVVQGQLDCVTASDQLLALEAQAELHLLWLHGLAGDLLKCHFQLSNDFLQFRKAHAWLQSLCAHVEPTDVLAYMSELTEIRRGVLGNVNPELSLQTALLPWLNRLKLQENEMFAALS